MCHKKCHNKCSPMRNLVSLLCTRNKRITSYYEVYDAKYIDVGDTLEDLDSIEGR